ncbi:hypothetical protein D3C77_459640 [compost metagenome]
MAKMGELLSFGFYSNCNVLSWFIGSYRIAVFWHEIKGSYFFRLLYFAINDKTTEAPPSPRLLLGLLVHFRFHANKYVRDNPVGFTPGFQNIIGCCFAKHGFDGAKQVFSYDWVMLRKDAESPVLLRDAANDRQNLFKGINMRCSSIDSIGERCRLFALALIGVVKNIQQFRMVTEHRLIKCTGNRFSVNLKHGDS